jgi:hypothetical protein
VGHNNAEIENAAHIATQSRPASHRNQRPTSNGITGPLGPEYAAGPRVRIYCLYNDDAVEGDDANETALSFDPTDGDWHMSLPCPAEDLSWVSNALKGKCKRVTARDMETVLDSDEEESSKKGATETTVDLEAFFKS